MPLPVILIVAFETIINAKLYFCVKLYGVLYVLPSPDQEAYLLHIFVNPLILVPLEIV